MVHFRLTIEQEEIRQAAPGLCSRFPASHWLKKDKEGGFPQNFCEAAGIGHMAPGMAVQYANQRIVFDRAMGMNRGIQRPLAPWRAKLEAAHLMACRSAAPAEAAIKTCKTARIAHGGHAKEFHVERRLREAFSRRIAPTTPHLISFHLAEKKLGLPKSR
jgi:acyl-CoA dehydrogenase